MSYARINECFYRGMWSSLHLANVNSEGTHPVGEGACAEGTTKKKQISPHFCELIYLTGVSRSYSHLAVISGALLR